MKKEPNCKVTLTRLSDGKQQDITQFYRWLVIFAVMGFVALTIGFWCGFDWLIGKVIHWLSYPPELALAIELAAAFVFTFVGYCPQRVRRFLNDFFTC